MLALVDQLKNKLGRAVILLGGELDGKVVLVAGVTQDPTGQLKAGELMKQAAAAVGGKGGGRPDMAQGGGTNVAKLDEALALAQRFVEQGSDAMLAPRQSDAGRAASAFDARPAVRPASPGSERMWQVQKGALHGIRRFEMALIVQKFEGPPSAPSSVSSRWPRR